MVFNLQELQVASDFMLERWWEQWRDPGAASTQLHQYATWLKHWRHLEAHDHYLYQCKMPKQLQILLLRLRTFNLKLATHVHKWGGRGEQATGPGCRRCQRTWQGQLPTEDEQHVLFECPSYAGLRQQYGIPCRPDARVFLGEDAWQTARFLRAALRARDSGATACCGTTLWWLVMASVAICILIATLSWALDAYRVLL
jgi:hypothetical protein